MASWQKGKSTKWQIVKMASCQKGKSTKWQVKKMLSQKNSQFDKMAG
jgi:hypothetical protein